MLNKISKESVTINSLQENRYILGNKAKILNLTNKSELLVPSLNENTQ